MASHIKCKVLNANEDFVLLWNFKLITCLIDCFTLGKKAQSSTYLLGGSEHIYWILNPKDEVHSI